MKDARDELVRISQFIFIQTRQFRKTIDLKFIFASTEHKSDA